MRHYKLANTSPGQVMLSRTMQVVASAEVRETGHALITMLILAFGAVCFESVGRGADVPTEALNNSEPGAILSFDSDRSRVFLSAVVNGTGPHRFLVDTGYGLTMVQPELVDELDPPRAGRVDIIGIAGCQRFCPSVRGAAASAVRCGL